VTTPVESGNRCLHSASSQTLEMDNMKKIISFIVVALTAVSAIAGEPTGISHADDTLKKDVLREIISLENKCRTIGQKGIPATNQPEIVSYQPITAPADTDPWEEMWTVQRQGYAVQYKILFTPTPKQGGCSLKVSAMFGADDFKDDPKTSRQAHFFTELENYSLPSESIPSKFPPSNPSLKLYLAAERIAKEKGLISDGSMSSGGRLVVGKKQKDDSVILGIQLLQFDGGGVGFEYIKKWDVLNIETGQKMEKEYISALTKELHENFNK
jgi:hypothetical protein